MTRTIYQVRHWCSSRAWWRARTRLRSCGETCGAIYLSGYLAVRARHMAAVLTVLLSPPSVRMWNVMCCVRLLASYYYLLSWGCCFLLKRHFYLNSIATWWQVVRNVVVPCPSEITFTLTSFALLVGSGTHVLVGWMICWLSTIQAGAVRAIVNKQLFSLNQTNHSHFVMIRCVIHLKYVEVRVAVTNVSTTSKVFTTSKKDNFAYKIYIMVGKNKILHIKNSYIILGKNKTQNRRQ